ncbi:MAG: hypothetical protein H0X46_04590 [Bacteroidetes bacterium]|nr:hypothetical protein [Bacteroidota bacterium]
MKQKQVFAVYINYPDYTVKADIFSEQKKIRVNEELIYFWYSSNKILETKGGYDGKLLHGGYTSYYLTKELKEKGTFTKGLKHGKWMRWYENGKIAEINCWKNGIKNGVFKNFDAKGNLLLETEFKNGKLNGTETVYENGVLVRKRNFRNGGEVIKNSKEKKHPAKEKISEENRKEGDIKDNASKKDPKPRKGKETKPAPTDAAEKKTLKERWQKIFKKKEKSKNADK